ncbi:hypothetical protein L7F22_062773 [Adiantum nelumboides]|nr:hypothetical protein [Adiantum nelumboides]
MVCLGPRTPSTPPALADEALAHSSSACETQALFLLVPTNDGIVDAEPPISPSNASSKASSDAATAASAPSNYDDAIDLGGKCFKIKASLNVGETASQSPQCSMVPIPVRHEKWEVYKGEHFYDESLLFMVKRKSWVQLKAHLTVSLRGNDDNGTPDIEVRGNYKETEGQILRGDKLVAKITKKRNLLLSFLT